jgi:hypothetical protein
VFRTRLDLLTPAVVDEGPTVVGYKQVSSGTDMATKDHRVAKLAPLTCPQLLSAA